MHILLDTPKEFNGMTATKVQITESIDIIGEKITIRHKLFFKDSDGNMHREWSDPLVLRGAHYSDVTKADVKRSVNMTACHQKVIDFGKWSFDGSGFAGTIVN